VAAGVVAATAAWTWSRRAPVVMVSSGDDVAAAIERAPDGAVLRLAPGRYEPFSVSRDVTVEGPRAAEVRGPVLVRADGATLAGFTVTGGKTGVRVRDADDVVLRDLRVTGSILHGIEVAPGSVRVSGCTIDGLVSKYAQGFEIRMTSGRGRTVVEDCRIAGGQEGIVSHVSHVEFVDNVVTGTTLRALVITEESEGIMRGNVVRDVTGTALYCGDGARCEIRDNVVRGVGATAEGGPANAGWGAQALYRATMRLDGNRFERVDAGEVRTSLNGVVVDWFPLVAWPLGWRGLLPGLPIVLASGSLVVAALSLPFAPVVARRRRRLEAGLVSARPISEGLAGFAFAVVGVMAIHMFEHVVQVWQVKVADTEVRSGVAGSVFDVEWVHFAFNVGTLGFVAWLAVTVWRGRWSRRAVGWPLTGLAVAFAIQGYHFVEHVTRVIQHLRVGIDPAPGLLGAHLNLVWFHFGMNLTVFLCIAVSFAALVRVHSHAPEASAAAHEVPAMRRTVEPTS
jgi:hypothetical protein